jgi:hypothetical protein
MVCACRGDGGRKNEQLAPAWTRCESTAEPVTYICSYRMAPGQESDAAHLTMELASTVDQEMAS